MHREPTLVPLWLPARALTLLFIIALTLWLHMSTEYVKKKKSAMRQDLLYH